MKITFLVKKNEDWLVVGGTEAGAEYHEVSINRLSKKGVAFPGFDDIKIDSDVQGRLWKSPANKWYLFPPDAEKPHYGANNANKTAVMEKMMEKKEDSIKKFQNSKEDSIKLMAAQRDAVLIVNTLMAKDMGVTWIDSEIKKEIIDWRNWFLLGDFNDIPPFED